MSGGAACQSQPSGKRRAAAHRRQAEIQGDQGEAGVNQQLCGGQGIPEIFRPHPQQVFQVDPDLRRGLWVQLLPLVNEGCRFAGAGHCPQCREQGGEAAAGPTARELHQVAPGQAASEKAIEADQGRWQGLFE